LVLAVPKLYRGHFIIYVITILITCSPLVGYPASYPGLEGSSMSSIGPKVPYFSRTFFENSEVKNELENGQYFFVGHNVKPNKMLASHNIIYSLFM
jgi:hypothetical protein